ncbi:hypothetical protein MIMGU_mgv1a005363mg [Erythranthe guttata]|uniref:CTLH domain-containing protein n=1 Tax=Erythranthe guttata TaxID=4155 RepID=A0A022RS22_ERYGU|nr:hypothetical protein MIMGU_mgv1a005363mg [Erythranthe guttata]
MDLPSASSQGGDEFVGSKRVIKKVELVRVITEVLYSLGYDTVGKSLERESGIHLHAERVHLLIEQIIAGKWNESLATVRDIGKSVDKISLLILKYKFSELISEGELERALKTLQKEISPLSNSDEIVREASSLIIFPPQNLLGQEPNPRSRTEVLKELRKLFPPEVMVPDKRLVDLVEQAIEFQKGACKYHNSFVREVSLITNHQCGRNEVPSIILKVEAIDSLKWKGDLFDRQAPVTNITWSPDNTQLLTCGSHEAVRRWSIPSCGCLHTYKKTGVGMVSCEWAPDGQSIFTGGNDDSIVMWSLEGREIGCWKGDKTTLEADMAITGDGREVITTCNQDRILLFNWKRGTSRFITEMGRTIISFCLSEDSKYLLLSLLNQELHLWSIEVPPKLVKVYKAHRPPSYSVRACFGGPRQMLIVCGSVDSQVYIWDRETEGLIGTLAGHTKRVNCVSCHPVDPYMLASGSDDNTIRIWGNTNGDEEFRPN